MSPQNRRACSSPSLFYLHYNRPTLGFFFFSEDNGCNIGYADGVLKVAKTEGMIKTSPFGY
jgi:hypothetical protein